jgi:hypothetical protein
MCDGLYGSYRFHNVLTTTLTCRGGARCRRHVVLEAHSNWCKYHAGHQPPPPLAAQHDACTLSCQQMRKTCSSFTRALKNSSSFGLAVLQPNPVPPEVYPSIAPLTFFIMIEPTAYDTCSFATMMQCKAIVSDMYSCGWVGNGISVYPK